MLYRLITPKVFVELCRDTSRRVVPVDSTWYLPNLKKDGINEFLEIERIPNAVYFDIDSIKNLDSPYPHMLPDLATFNSGMSQLGIKNEDILVVYDRIGNFSAPRCAWTLGVMGHKSVFLLNNFNLYKSEGYQIEKDKIDKLTPYEPSNYESKINLSKDEVVTYKDMLKLVETGKLSTEYNCFDARALGRFTGEESEPRPGLPSGHVPGAIPMPFTEVLNENGLFPEDSEAMKQKLNDYFNKNNIEIDLSKPTIAMCGTGVTGTIIKTALEHSGLSNIKLYDGSWTEWALRTDPKYIVSIKNR